MQKKVFFRTTLFFLFVSSFLFIASAKESKPDEKGETAPLQKIEKLTDFMRVSKQEGRRPPMSFDTAIVRFADQKGIEVDLIAAVHVGDKEYYEELNELFKDYDALLYELVAEEGTVLDKKTLEDRKGKSPLAGFQRGMGETLELDFQLEHVDYTADNFVHADLTPDEFVRRVSERGDLMQMIFRAITVGAKKEGQDNELRLQGKLFGTLFASNRSLALKRLLAKEMINQLDDSVWIIGGDGSAIITDRNEAALKVLRKQIKDGKKKLGIFYGGAHLPEFAKSLKKEFKMNPVSVRWIIAWDLTSDKSARQ